MTVADPDREAPSVEEGATPSERLLANVSTVCARVLNPGLVEAALAVIFAGTLAVITVLSVVRPAPDWDALAYYALALEKPDDTAADKHAKAYEAIREQASATQFIALTQDDAYRKRQFADPLAFQSMMPMYAVKAGYIASLRALEPSMGIANAAQAVNVAAMFVLAILCLWWMRQGGFLQAAPLVLVVMLMLETRSIVSGATPDIAAAALTLCAFYALWSRKDWIALPFLLAAITFRPDTLLFAFALILAFAACRERLLPVSTIFGACLAAYILLTSGNGHIGWWAHYWFSNVQYQNDMTGFTPDFSVFAYLKGQARGILMSVSYFNWPFLGIVLLGGWAMLMRMGKSIPRRTTALLVASVLVIGGKFVTFPLPDDRIYMAFILAGSMLLLSVWKPKAVG